MQMRSSVKAKADNASAPKRRVQPEGLLRRCVNSLVHDAGPAGVLQHQHSITSYHIHSDSRPFEELEPRDAGLPPAKLSQNPGQSEPTLELKRL